MPPANEVKNRKLRILAFGPAKVKKTWWAVKAADAGFNVLLLDGDDGSQILTQVAKESLERIHVINIVDKQEMPVMCHFLTRFLKGDPFMWEEEDKTILLRAASAKQDCSYYIFDPSKLTTNDVVIIDSWSALCWSLAWRWYRENNVKVDDADQAKTSQWNGYRWSGAMASWMLKQIKTLNCHVIVIGHQSVYEKRHDEVIGGKIKQVVEWSRTQAKSISGPHGLELAKEFSEVLFFSVNGSRFSIDSKSYKDRDGGCRVIPPKIWNWDELQFGDIIKMAGITPANPETILDAAHWYPSGTDLPEGKVITQGNEGKPLEAKEVKPSAFAGLLKPNGGK